MVRRLAVFLAALPLGGCLEDPHRLEVTNQGGSEVEVKVVYDEWVEDEEGWGYYETQHDDTIVAPGRKVELGYPDEPLHVRIQRTVDGLVLYDEWLSSAEFDEEHGRVEIVVYP